MKDLILSTQSLSYVYEDGTEALNSVCLDVERGKKIAVLGANGAGKSTLFLLFIGILKPTAGHLFHRGKQVRHDAKSLFELRKNVGYVFQDPDSQLIAATVYQEVSFGPMNLGLPHVEIKRRIGAALGATGISGLEHKHTQFLSYGQKKSVSIAGILAMETEVIIFDEPTAGLDPNQKLKMQSLLGSMNRDGKTIIISTHDVDFAYSWADEVVVLKNGCLIKLGNPQQVFADRSLLDSAGLAKPWVLEISQALIGAGRNFDLNKQPRNKAELLAMISGAPAQRARARTGMADDDPTQRRYQYGR